MNENNTSYSYELNADDSCRITAYQGDAVMLTVPTELDGHKVIDIGIYAFANCQHLKHVIIPEGVVTLFINAFYNCPELETISLPNTIENNVNSSVRACPKFTGYKVNDDHEMFELKDGVLFNKEVAHLVDYPAAMEQAEYTVPAGTVEVMRGAFAEHKYLQRVVLPEGLVKIGDGAFRGCEALREVVLPSTLEIIGGQAFAGCTALESIMVPTATAEIGQNAFSSCWSLQDIAVEAESNHFCDTDGALYTADMKKLVRYPVDGRMGYVVPEGVEVIGTGAFSGCETLAEVRLPSTLKVIEGSAFAHCNMLDNVVVPEGVEAIAPATFFGCTNLAEIELPMSVKTIGQQAFWYCFSLMQIELAEDCKTADDTFGGEAEVLEGLGMDCIPEIIRK